MIATCFSRHCDGFLGLDIGLLAVEMRFGGVCGSGFRQSFGVKGADDSGRILVDHREQRPGGRLWRAPSAFPMLNGIETEAEGVRKTRLGHAELATDAFYVNFIRHMHLEAFLLSC